MTIFCHRHAIVSIQHTNSAYFIHVMKADVMVADNNIQLSVGRRMKHSVKSRNVKLKFGIAAPLAFIEQIA